MINFKLSYGLFRVYFEMGGRKITPPLYLKSVSIHICRFRKYSF